MKYLVGFLIAVAALLGAESARAAIAHVVSTTAGASAPGTTVTTSSVDTTGANLLVVAVSYYGSANDPTLSDSKGNTWTGLTARESNGTSPAVRLYWCKPTSVGSGHTFTAAQAGSFPVVSMSAFSGAATSPYDQESGTAVATGSTSYQPGSITPSENNCVLVTGVATAGTSHSVNSSFNATATDNLASNHIGGGIAYKIQTTAGAENPTWSWTTSTNRAAAMASFKASANVINPLSSTIPGSGIDPLNRGPVQ